MSGAGDEAAGGTPAITPSSRALPEGAAQAFDAIGTARRLLQEASVATLATLDPVSGYPLATLVTFAPAGNGAPLLFLSALSLHTRNLMADTRASLLIASGGKGDPLAHPRLSLVGRCHSEDDRQAKARFLKHHPKAALYAELPDFSLWRFDIEAAHLNGGFARAGLIAAKDLLGEEKHVG